MFIVRVLTAAAKPLLVGGALTAAAAGSLFYITTRGPGDVSAFQRIQGHGQRLLISEFSDDADTIVAVDPNDTTDRTIIAQVDHARGYGIFPVLSPDGKAIAYTGLAASSPRPSPDTPALAAVVDVNGKPALLADDVDLLVAPVWQPDSRAIVVRKSATSDDATPSMELLLLNRDGTRSTITTWASAAVFPISFSPDGSKLYFAALNNSGTELYSVAPDGSGETRIAHLSDGIARDWKLSRDGAKLAYSVADASDAAGATTRVLDLASGAAEPAVRSQSGAAAEYNPAWNGAGDLTISSVKPDGGGDASIATSGEPQRLTSNTDSIDLPLAWSPDDASLAVRAVDGKNASDAGASHIDLVTRDGMRSRVSDNGDTLIVGWLP